MTHNLRWLVWLAALIILANQAMEWEGELKQLQPEMKRLTELRSRERSSITSVNWSQQEQQALEAQLQWLERLPSITQTGTFRAQAMESLGDLCERLKAGCRVSAQGETVSPSGQDAQFPGLIYANVRVSVPLQYPHLDTLLGQIEQGPILRKIEKLAVRSGTIELQVRTYGLNSSNWQTTYDAAQRDLRRLTQTAAEPSNPKESSQ